MGLVSWLVFGGMKSHIFYTMKSYILCQKKTGFLLSHDRKHPSKKQLVLGGRVSVVLLLCTKFFWGWNFIANAPKEGFPGNGSGGKIWSFGQTYGFVAYLATNFFAESRCAELHVIYMAAALIEMKQTCLIPQNFQKDSKELFEKKGAPSCLEPLQKNRATSRGQQFFALLHMVVYICSQVHPRRPGWVRWREKIVPFTTPKGKNGEMKWWFSKVS